MSFAFAEVARVLAKQRGKKKIFKKGAGFMVGEERPVAFAVAFHALAIGWPVVGHLRPAGVESGVGHRVNGISLLHENVEFLMRCERRVCGRPHWFHKNRSFGRGIRRKRSLVSRPWR